MHAQETLRRERGLHVLEAEEGGDGRAALDMQAHILACTLQIYDVGNLYELGLIVCLNRNNLLVGCLSLVLCDGTLCGVAALHEVDKRDNLLRGLHKLLIREWLEQIVYGIELEALECELGVCRSKYDVVSRVYATHEVDAIHIGHINIDKEKVCLGALEHLLCFARAATHGNQLKLLGALNVTLYLS